jgi:hypothetical protein
MRVSRAAASPATYRYGIVNFRFVGTDTFTTHDAAGNPIAQSWRLVLDLPHPQGAITVYVEPLANYSQLAQTISTTRRVAVTCEAAIDAATLPAGLDPDDVVSDVCLLLSVARGTLVQWLYRRDMASSGEIASHHVSHITRRFQGMEPLDHRPPRRADTKRFIEGAYAALPGVSQTYGLSRGLVLAYVDARSEDDALEMRGVKLSVLAEMIKAQHQGSISIPTAAPWTWARLRALPQRLRNPGHPRFATALRSACRSAGYSPSRSVIDDFVASRNRLIHAGRFRSDPVAPLACRFSSQAGEYMFMLSFIDRFFLRLLGYSGPFIEWSRYPQHEQGTV